MTEAPPDPPLSKKKYFLILLVIVAVFFTVAPYLLGGVLSLVYPTRDVELDTALADARVTNIWMNRQYYLYYLNDDRWVMHDFNAYVAADSADRKGRDSNIGWDASDLAHYLERGDRISKVANSPLLTVQRGAVVTHWILYSATPEGQRPPPDEQPVIEDDSIRIP